MGAPMTPRSPLLVIAALVPVFVFFAGCAENPAISAASEKPAVIKQAPARRSPSLQTMPTNVRLWLT